MTAESASASAPFGDPTGARVAVLYGGLTAERSVSLKTGRAVLEALADRPCSPVGIDFGRDGVARLCEARPDVVFIALHGGVGEGGAVQGLLECLGVPYTGSGVLASALAMDKVQSKRVFAAAEVPTPAWWVASPGEPAPASGYPWVVKPSLEGSSVGVAWVDEPGDWSRALEVCAAGAGSVLVERAIRGRELTVALMDDRVLGSVEVRPVEGFFDFAAKYERADTGFLCPAPLAPAEQEAVEAAALSAWRALGCRGVGRVDVMMESEEGLVRPWVLEANTIPGLTATSLVPRVAALQGWTFGELVWRMLAAARTDAPPGGEDDDHADT